MSVRSKRAERTEQIAQLLSVDPEGIAESPYVLAGSAEEIADDLRRYRERWGVSCYTVMGDVAERFSAVVAERSGE